MLPDSFNWQPSRTPPTPRGAPRRLRPRSTRSRARFFGPIPSLVSRRCKTAGPQNDPVELFFDPVAAPWTPVRRSSVSVENVSWTLRLLTANLDAHWLQQQSRSSFANPKEEGPYLSFRRPSPVCGDLAPRRPLPHTPHFLRSSFLRQRGRTCSIRCPTSKIRRSSALAPSPSARKRRNVNVSIVLCVWHDAMNVR